MNKVIYTTVYKDNGKIGMTIYRRTCFFFIKIKKKHFDNYDKCEKYISHGYLGRYTNTALTKLILLDNKYRLKI